MQCLYLFKSKSGRWMGESPFLPGRYFLGTSQEEVLARLRLQIQERAEELRKVRVFVPEDKNELLIVGL